MQWNSEREASAMLKTKPDNMAKNIPGVRGLLIFYDLKRRLTRTTCKSLQETYKMSYKILVKTSYKILVKTSYKILVKILQDSCQDLTRFLQD